MWLKKTAKADQLLVWYNKSMQLPKTLKIGAHKFKIKLERGGALGTDCAGKCDYTKNTITIDADLEDSQIVATLWHEIFHALNNELSEKDVDFLAQGVTQVVLDNQLSFRKLKK